MMPVQNVTDNDFSLKKGIYLAIACLIAFFVYWFLPDSCPEAARRTAFVFVVAAILWAFEILPLYVTSLLIIVLLTFSLGKPDGVMNMGFSGYTLFLLPFSSPVIMLFFGGFMLAQALRKYSVDSVVAHAVISKFGTKPLFVLFGILVSTALLSMWISNTVTTVIMLGILLPSLEAVDIKGTFKKALLLAIPYGANIGGIATPIGSPPNAIALGYLSEYGYNLDFFDWMIVCVPLALLILVVTGIVLYLIFPAKDTSIQLLPEKEVILSAKGKLVLVIAGVTICLFLTFPFHGIPYPLVALLCVCMLLMSGLLVEEDLKAIAWDILILMWGSLALGLAVAKSGLASWFVILPVFDQHGALLVFIFCILAVLLSMFISNTATVALLLPIVLGIEGENKIALAITITLVSNLAMVFPISTPPNAIAYSSHLFKTKDMVKAGLVISIISVALILVGYEVILPILL
jgi:solute carrier family 13 (sodium-dependent dicarboxylate transporter), member 2/3/5